MVERSDVATDRKPAQAVQSDVFRWLDGMGLMERSRQAFGPFMDDLDLRLGDFRARGRYADPKEPWGGSAFVHRKDLDPMLLEYAEESGAVLIDDFKAESTITRNGRVVGIQGTRRGRSHRLFARLVVGADGRTSSLATMVGSRRYNESCTDRGYCWGYFDRSGDDAGSQFIVHRWKDNFYWGGAAPNGQIFVGTSFARSRLDDIRQDRSAAYIDLVKSCDGTAHIAHSYGLAKPPKVAMRFHGFFREPTGPGWVLVGDSGHFKDPVAGRGIGDAIHQVRTVTPFIIRGLGSGSERSLDQGLERWGRQRDRDLVGHYWNTIDLSDPDPLSPVLPAVLRQWPSEEAVRLVGQVLIHELTPRQLVTPPRVLRATAAMLAQNPRNSPDTLRELGRITKIDLIRRLRERRPSHQRVLNEDVASVSERLPAPTSVTLTNMSHSDNGQRAELIDSAARG